MLNVGPAEVLIILVVALLVLGPKKLPEAARQIGKAMTEFRRVTSGLQDEVRHVLDDHIDATPAATPEAPPLLEVDPTPSPVFHEVEPAATAEAAPLVEVDPTPPPPSSPPLSPPE